MSGLSPCRFACLLQSLNRSHPWALHSPADMAGQEAEGMIRAAFQAGHLAALRVFDTAPRTYDFPKGSRWASRQSCSRREHRQSCCRSARGSSRLEAAMEFLAGRVLC